MSGGGAQASEGPNDWDEARLEAALERLQEMHIQLRGLRGVLNDVISPLSISYATPEELYKRYANKTKAASKRLETFNLYMNSTESKDVLQQAKISREQSQPKHSWTPADHPDWLDRKDSNQANAAPTSTVIESENANNSEEDITSQGTAKEIVGEFLSAHSEIVTSLDDETGVIKVKLPPPANLQFQLEPNSEGRDQTLYQVSCDGSSQLHAAVFNSIQARQKPHDLNYMLEMLASYIDLKTRPCARCNKLLDGRALFPVVRLQRMSKQADETVLKTWEAIHEGCI